MTQMNPTQTTMFPENLSVKDQAVLLKMKQTLDMTLLTDLSANALDWLYNEIQKPSDSIPRSKSALHRLIGNTFEKIRNPPVYFRYLLGPQLVHRVDIADKQILFFGERHLPYELKDYTCTLDLSEDDNVENTIRITPFFKWIFSMTSVPIDFFLETPPIPDSLNFHATGDLDHLRSAFRYCLPVSTKCNMIYHTVRMHWVDVRLLQGTGFQEFMHFIVGVHSFTEKFIGMLQVAMKMNQNHDFENILKLIDKQLQTVTVSSILAERDALKRELETPMNITQFAHLLNMKNEEITSLFEPSKTYALQLPQPNAPILYWTMFLLKDGGLSLSQTFLFQRPLLQLCKYWMNIGVRLQDLYTLGRMFRTFRSLEDKVSVPPRNIIFYGGADHVENMVKILSETKDVSVKHSVLDYPFSPPLKWNSETKSFLSLDDSKTNETANASPGCILYDGTVDKMFGFPMEQVSNQLKQIAPFLE